MTARKPLLIEFDDGERWLAVPRELIAADESHFLDRPAPLYECERCNGAHIGGYICDTDPS